MSQKTAVSPITEVRGVGLEVWMRRVLDRVENARPNLDAEAVHGLRTALRRCRTMSEALSEVNPDSVWRKIKKSSRELFRALGALRDAQVEREWVKKLAPPRDPLRSRFLRLLSRREKEQLAVARKALDDFDLKDWKKLARKVERKAGLFPVESVVFQRLALAKLEEFAELLGRARKSRGGPSWHRARMGLKHFRYIAENFVPRKFALVSTGVKQLQDLLGAAQDLYVLRADLARHAAEMDPESVARWIASIQVERKARLGEAAAKVTGSGSLLAAWRAAFQWPHPLPFSAALHRRTA
jgi:CHAD domain-containing protein